MWGWQAFVSIISGVSSRRYLGHGRSRKRAAFASAAIRLGQKAPFGTFQSRKPSQKRDFLRENPIGIPVAN
jgi:hypothetical protein